MRKQSKHACTAITFESKDNYIQNSKKLFIGKDKELKQRENQQLQTSRAKKVYTLTIINIPFHRLRTKINQF